MDNDLRTPAPPALSPSAIAALYKGNKIEGIKIIREERNRPERGKGRSRRIPGNPAILTIHSERCSERGQT